MTVSSDLWRFHAVHHDTAVIRQYCQYLLEYFFQFSPMPTDKYSIRARKCRDVLFKKITYVDINAWRSETAGILLDNGLTLRTNFEGLDL